MAEIQPFPGILYRVPEAELPKVLAPPYDVIPPAYQDELYASRPAQHRARGAEPDARERRLRGGGGHVPPLAARRACSPPTPSRASTCSSRRSPSRGGRPALRPPGALPRRRTRPRGVILPHEQTRKGAKEDRYQVLRATRANFSPIFMMFSDPENRSRLRSWTRSATGRPSLHRRRGRRAPRLARHRDGARLRVSATSWPERAPTSPTATTATRRRCATATRRCRRGLDVRLLHARWAPRPARAALPPHPLRRAVPRGGAASSRAGSTCKPRRTCPRPRRRWPLHRVPTRSRWPSPAAGARRRVARRGARRSSPETRRPACARSTRSSCTRRCSARVLGVPDSAVRYVHSLARRRRRWPGGLPAGRAAARDAGPPDRGRLGGRGVHAREEHVLPSQAALRAGDPSARRLMRAFDPSGSPPPRERRNARCPPAPSCRSV